MMLQFNKEVEIIFFEVISDKKVKSILRDIMDNDIKLYLHLIRVCILCIDIGIGQKMNKKDLYDLAYSAILHDLAKLYLPKEIFNKKKLTEYEGELVRSVPRKTFSLLKNLKSNFIRKIIVAHHEFYRNDAYPRRRFQSGVSFKNNRRKKEEKVEKFAQILSIVNLFENSISNFYSKNSESYNLQDEVNKFLKHEFVGNMSYVDEVVSRIRA